MKLRFVMLIGLALCLQALGAQSPYVRVYRPANIVPPPVPHEFRGAWISVVATNQDWPSKPGLSAQEQKAELVALLDRAVQLHLNAIVFQVRPACDAVYASSIEPWSACLTGIQGNAPEPFYDPLAFAVAEAHKRGLELHAWFNPFRAWHFQSKSPVAPNHISRTHPELVRRYGSQLWLDPGDPEVRNYVDRVVLDVVKRYDIDGVQFDDYFYPYPEKDAEGRPLPFPDEATWKRYGLANGFDLADWRRQNINQFVAKVYHDIKAAKPWVKFGISPFGIWRPENPAPIRGMDAYATLYADSRRWLASGWVDYLAPQLYWSTDAPQQSFPVLLHWWLQQNTAGRNVFAGLSAAYAGHNFPITEIGRQIAETRSQAAGGEILFHLHDLIDKPALNQLIREEYAQPALGPRWPWLDAAAPQKPVMAVKPTRDGLEVKWASSGGEAPWLWVLQTRGTNTTWLTRILPAMQTSIVLPYPSPGEICVMAVDRLGNTGAPASIQEYLVSRYGKGMGAY